MGKHQRGTHYRGGVCSPPKASVIAILSTPPPSNLLHRHSSHTCKIIQNPIGLINTNAAVDKSQKPPISSMLLPIYLLIC